MTGAARSVLITGCSSGIGYACARGMLARGWRVFATARKPADLERLEANGLEAIHLELTDKHSIDACARTVLERTQGRLDAIFNNAAYGQPGAVEDLRPDVLKAQFEVNLFGTHALTCAVLPSMRQQGHGRIVQCSSVLGLVSPPFRGAYNATKFALEALSDAMRHELAGSGIRISLIEPGPISSRFLEHAIARFKANIDMEGSAHRETYKKRLDAMEKGGRQTFKLEPEAVLGKLVHALESPRPKRRYYVTLPTYLVAYGRRVLPDAIADRFIRTF